MAIKDWWGWKDAAKDFDYRLGRIEKKQKQNECSHPNVIFRPARNTQVGYWVASASCEHCEKLLDLETERAKLCKSSQTPTS